MNLMQDGELLTVAFYIVLSVVLGFAATYLGLLLVKSL
jgi:fluoride ion exporter CrcB/FEX